MKSRMFLCSVALICAWGLSMAQQLAAQGDGVAPAAEANKAAAEAQRAAALAQKAAADAHQKALELFRGAQDKVELVLALDETAEKLPHSEYWLGVQVASLPEVAKKQLALDDGLAVEEVTEGSPAAKAEIKKFDILVRAAEMPLKSLGDLIKAVDASQGKELTVTIVRDGKQQTLKVIAEKRPASGGNMEAIRKTITAARPELAGEIKKIEEALENLKSKVGKEGVGVWFAKPAVVAPRIDVRAPEVRQITARFGEFPKDLSVQVNKQGGQPAKIHVKRGDREWDVTEDKLSELPAEIQHHVKQLLGKSVSDVYALRVSPAAKDEGSFQIAPFPPKPPTPPQAASPPKEPAAPQATRSYTIRTGPPDAEHLDAKLTALMKALEGRNGILEKLEQQIEELRKDVEGLKKK